MTAKQEAWKVGVRARGDGEKGKSGGDELSIDVILNERLGCECESRGALQIWRQPIFNFNPCLGMGSFPFHLTLSLWPTYSSRR